MMFDSATVSVATVYGFKDAKTLQQVFEHWTLDRDCTWHNGPYSYLTRQALEKEGSLKEIHFRYDKLGEVVILRLVRDEGHDHGRKDGWYADIGPGEPPEFVCGLTCNECHHMINPEMVDKHDKAHHSTALHRPKPGLRMDALGESYDRVRNAADD